MKNFLDAIKLRTRPHEKEPWWLSADEFSRCLSQVDRSSDNREALAKLWAFREGLLAAFAERERVGGRQP